MRITTHNKLVRDLIPEQIESDGNIPHTRILSNQEFTAELIKKMHEEIDEYNTSKSAEELADIWEVFLALIQNAGVSYNELESIRIQKKEKNGGFERKLLISIIYFK